MRLFNKLQPQELSPEAEVHRRALDMEERINLKEPVDEDSLESFWNQVEEDIHSDPEWFNFSS